MLKHEEMVGKLVQKNLFKASQFEAKATKLNEKASATATYPSAQVNKFSEKAASEELKAEQYRAGALLTAQESSLPGGGVLGVAMQPPVKGQDQGQVQGQDKSQGQDKGQDKGQVKGGQDKGQGPPPPPLRSSATSSSNVNTVSSITGKENVMLASKPQPLSSPPAPSTATSIVATASAATVPLVPLTGGASAPGLGASQMGRTQGLDTTKQGLASASASAMQSSKAPLPDFLMDGSNKNKQAGLMQTSLKVCHHHQT